MANKLKLDNASSQYGAAMGRRNELPADPELPIKLRLEALRWVDGDYDQGGAYWGNSGGTSIYCGWSAEGDGENRVRVFARATDREDAQEKIRELIPGAKFFR